MTGTGGARTNSVSLVTVLQASPGWRERLAAEQQDVYRLPLGSGGNWDKRLSLTHRQWGNQRQAHKPSNSHRDTQNG